MATILQKTYEIRSLDEDKPSMLTKASDCLPYPDDTYLDRRRIRREKRKEKKQRAQEKAKERKELETRKRTFRKLEELIVSGKVKNLYLEMEEALEKPQELNLEVVAKEPEIVEEEKFDEEAYLKAQIEQKENNLRYYKQQVSLLEEQLAQLSIKKEEKEDFYIFPFQLHE